MSHILVGSMDTQNKYLSVVSGCLCVLLGVIVIYGWHTQSLSLIQIHSSFAPMQYNTALGFLFCGLGLICINFEYLGLGRFFGGTASLIGLITLAQYQWGINTGLDELLMKGYVNVKTSHPGRMAPNTALCFLLSGMALFFSNAIHRKTRLITAVKPLEIFGAVIMGLGLVALAGYIFDIESAYSWGSPTRMAVHTSIGIAILGLGLIFYKIPVLEEDGAPRFPVFLVVGLLVVSVLFWKALIIEEEKKNINIRNHEVVNLKNLLTHRINQDILSLERLKQRWQNRLYSDKNQWLKDAGNYTRDKEELLAVEWVDENYIVRWIVPLKGSESVENLDLSFEENRKNVLDSAKKSGQTQLTGLIKFVQGGLGFLSASPIFVEGKFEGVILGVFEINKLLSSYTQIRKLKGLTIEYFDSKDLFKEEILKLKPSNHWEHHTKIDFGNISFGVNLIFDDRYFSNYKSRSPLVIGIAGIFLSIIFSLLVYYNKKSKFHSDILAKQANTKIKINEAILNSLLDNSPAIIYMKDMSGQYTHINKKFEQILGVNKADVVDKNTYEVHPRNVADKYVINDRFVIGTLEPLVTEEIFCVDNKMKTFHTVQFPLRDERGKPIGIAGISSDISVRKQNEAFLFFQNNALELMAHELSLTKVLEYIVCGIEEQTDNLKGSILLLDKTGKYLSHGVAPNLPQKYSEAIYGMSIGPSAGSCGTAVYKKEMVIVEDIASDPLWEDFRALALPCDLRACWSIPIFNRSGSVLGTFALYYNAPNRPTDWELEIMQSVAHLASLAIEQKRTQEDLEKYKKELEGSLTLNEERLQLFLEATTDGVWDWNLVTDEVFFSPSWLESLGYHPDELEPHVDSWKKLIHPDDMPRVINLLTDHLEGRTEFYQCENRLLKSDGSWRWNIDRGRVVKRDENGKAVRMVGSDTDITSLKEAEFALRSSEQNLVRAQKMASLGSWEFDVKNNSMTWSDEVYRIFGMEIKQFLGTYEAFIEMVHPGDRDWVHEANMEAIHKNKPYDLTHRILLPDGVVKFLQVKSRTFYNKDGNPERIVGTFLDITEKKIVEQELQKSHQQLRDLSNKLQSVREEEKKRISREIHDELGQTLTAIKLDLTWLEKRVDISEPQVSKKMQSIYSHLQESLETIRRVSTELRPQVLDVMGFCEALQWQVEKFMENTDINCELNIEPEGIRLNPELSTDLFRIFQEGLTNISRHSDATNVMVDFVENKIDYELTVKDDGVGIDSSRIKHSNSLGLLGMRERALIWNGHVEIKGVVGEGTLLKVNIPKVHNDR